MGEGGGGGRAEGATGGPVKVLGAVELRKLALKNLGSVDEGIGGQTETLTSTLILLSVQWEATPSPEC